MTIALCCCGTFGDIAPFLEIGSALKARGHPVVLLAPAPYADLSRQRGLDFVPTLTVQQFQSFVDDPRLWHPRGFFSPLVEKLMGPTIAPLLEWVLARPAQDLMLVSDFSSSPAARLASLRSGATHITAWRDVSGLRSRLDPSIISGAEFLTRLPGGLRRPLTEAIYWSSDLLAWWKLRPAFREHNFSPPLRLLDWMVSPRASLALFPDWFAPPPADWPAPLQCVGFPRYRQNESLPFELERFLERGPAPLVATLGSAMRQGQQDLGCIVQGVRQQGWRLVILGPNLPHYHGSDDLMAAGFVPMEALLARACGLIHHGGIGTTGQGLAAGLPQLVIPLAHDQYDNARRLVRLGVASCLPRQHLNPRRLCQHLPLLRQPQRWLACARWAARMEKTDAVLDCACRALEELATRK